MKPMSSTMRLIKKHLIIMLALALVLAWAGGGGGGGSSSGTAGTTVVASAITVSSPTEDEEINELVFRSTFEISLTYSGTSAIASDTLNVTFQMDEDAPQDITGYFPEDYGSSM